MTDLLPSQSASMASTRILISRFLAQRKCKYFKVFNLHFRKVHNETQKNTTHFGFESVSPEEKFQKVQSVFSSVASSYDLMNDVMSAGIHRIWKDYMMAALHPTPGTKLIDMAGGTGDIAFRFLNFIETYPIQRIQGSPGLPEQHSAHVTVCDFNIDMLRVGQQRAEKLGLNNRISWVHTDAQKLAFRDNSFDAYTISFGIRNVTHIDKALEEAYRVLKPGGRFVCLEFSQVQHTVLSQAYDWYSFEVIPVLGQIFTRDWKSYQYLVESIRRFPNQEEFKGLIETAGFRNVSYQNLLFGVACVHSGFKL